MQPAVGLNLELQQFRLMTLSGVVLLWRAGRRPDVPWSGRVLAGAMLAAGALRA